MGDTYKDKPDKYQDPNGKKRKPKEGRRFVSTKGRTKKNIIKNLEDYFI